MNNLNLMIGDWVSYNNEFIKVNGIIRNYPFDFFPKADVIVKDDDFSCFINIDVIQPIPLTPDLMDRIPSITLNENRGTRYSFLDGYYNLDIDNGIVCKFDDDGTLDIYTYEYYHERFQLICSIKYLHQLQQLIRLLTGKEIEVKWHSQVEKI